MNPTWPAPPEPLDASPWSAQLLALAPRGGEVRATPKPKPKPAPRPVQPAPRVTVTRRPERASRPEPRLRGLAFRFGVWFRPVVDGSAGTEVMVRPAALDRFLDRLRAGRERVALRLQHDPDLDLITTATEPGFRVWRDGGELHFEVRPTTRAGRLVARAVRATACRQVSIGIDTIGSVARGSASLEVAVADLTEISLVERGACPGVWLKAL